MPVRTRSVRVKGLSDLQRAFRRIGAQAGPEIRARLLRITAPAAADARAKLTARSKNPTGGRITFRPYSRQRSAGIRSTHPGAGVNEWGGTIRPRGTPITIEGKHAMVDAVEARHDQAERELGDLIDDLARGVGGFN